MEFTNEWGVVAEISAYPVYGNGRACSVVFPFKVEGVPPTGVATIGDDTLIAVEMSHISVDIPSYIHELTTEEKEMMKEMITRHDAFEWQTYAITLPKGTEQISHPTAIVFGNRKKPKVMLVEILLYSTKITALTSYRAFRESLVHYYPARSQHFANETQLHDHLIVGVKGDILGITFNEGRNEGVLSIQSDTSACIYVDADVAAPKPGRVLRTLYGDQIGEVVRYRPN